MGTDFSPWSQLGQVQATRFMRRLVPPGLAGRLASHSPPDAWPDPPLPGAALTVTTCHLPGSFGSCWICEPAQPLHLNHNLRFLYK
jgi:hypothetical protein